MIPAVTAPASPSSTRRSARCGIAWSARGVAGVQLPEASRRRTRARMRRRFPRRPREPRRRPACSAPSTASWRCSRGEASDLGDIALDLEAAPDFHRRVYEAARAIPPGQTMTYGEIARKLGAPHESREVGQALGRNPFAIIVPCHRVLAADGKVGGFSANGGVATKLRILEIEGASAVGAGPLFDRLK